MSFIDLSMAVPERPELQGADLETVKQFARGMGIDTDQYGRIPYVQWRSPLKTPGGYADIADLDDNGLRFLFRVPIPKSTTEVQGMTIAVSKDYPSVAYLEVVGTFDAEGDLQIELAQLVLPVFKIPGSRFDNFADVQIFVGGKRQRVSPYHGPPGTPTRISFWPEQSFADALESIGTDGSFTAEIGRFPTSSAPAPRVKLKADFKTLADDLKLLAAKFVMMKGRKARDDGKVYGYECMDGKCG